MVLQNYRGWSGFRINEEDYSPHPFEEEVMLREGLQMFVLKVEEHTMDNKKKMKEMQRQVKADMSLKPKLEEEYRFWQYFHQKTITLIHLCNFD